MPARSTETAPENEHNPMDIENVVVGLMALGLIVYLFVALIRPEKF